ncbi:MAG TPA: hypothetical protein VGF48_15805 [Thermoanaerobaculia bacterium]|jgi:hypothetical protein
MRIVALLLLLLAVPTFAQDVCDIAMQPAATLLVPYFEVELGRPITQARTTVFTIVNVSQSPQIANVTLWTNLDHPLLNFPVFLTGYDVQALNVYDILVGGLIAPTLGTSNATTPGSRSLANSANPKFLLSAQESCSRTSMPLTIPPSLLGDVRNGFEKGRVTGCGDHAVAIPASNGLTIGYITIDVVSTCLLLSPIDPGYYWDQLLHDNVLTGDWALISPNPVTGNYAAGVPMVHLRAMPAETTLPFTFYDRLSGRRDRRQPLPSTFAARYIEGGAFETELVIWREGMSGAPRNCSELETNETVFAEVVRLDERENPTVQTHVSSLPVVASVRTAADIFPPLTNDVGGWMYVNLNNGGSPAYGVAPGVDLISDSSSVRGRRQSQAWMMSRMKAEGRYSTGIEVTAMGNGCTPAPPSPAMQTVGAQIRPIAPTPSDDSCDIALLPAATLLLPRFEVDVDAPPNVAATTLFTVTNTTNAPRIARATVWTDWSYPLLTFDIYLTGYDVQAINLRDVLVDGRLPATGSAVSPRGVRSFGEIGGCESLPASLPPAAREDVTRALRMGLTGSCGTTRIGGTHLKAAGYVTIDLVSTCSAKAPGTHDELAFDNVLTGDYQYVDPNPATGNQAYGSPLVHIRAVSGQTAADLPHTFYERLTGHRRDRRQPLPAAFAARYIQGGSAGFLTDFVIWMDGTTGSSASCRDFAKNSAMPYIENVRFDERENPTTWSPSIIVPLPPEYHHPKLAATTRVRTSDSLFPLLESGDVAGWMYINLARLDQQAGPSQGWVVTTMHAEGRYAVAFDATSLGNGCAPLRPKSDAQNPIGPH